MEVFNELLELMNSLTKEFKTLKSDIKNIKSDISDLSKQVTNLKTSQEEYFEELKEMDKSILDEVERVHDQLNRHVYQ